MAKIKKSIIRNDDFKICNNCNPKRYLKFSFTYCEERGTPAQEDAYALINRLQFLSSDL